MSKVFVSSLDDNGIMKYVLCYDRNDPSKILTENWKPLFFDTESQAQAKLDMLESEREQEKKLFHSLLKMLNSMRKAISGNLHPLMPKQHLTSI